MAKASAALKKVADAGAPLYQSLNDDQKDRFKMLAHMLRPHHRMHAFMEQRGERFGEEDGGQGWRHHWQHNGLRFGQENGSDQDDRDSAALIGTNRFPRSLNFRLPRGERKAWKPQDIAPAVSVLPGLLSH